MPAQRPVGDAIAIYIITEVLRARQGGTQEAAFQEIYEGFDPSPLKRGVSPSFDTQTRKVVGDALSIDRIEQLYKVARRLLRSDEALRSEISSRVTLLKEAFAKKPGSTLRLFRERGPHRGIIRWWLVQCCPGEPPMFHLANEPPPGYGVTVLQGPTPDGRFK